VSIPTLIRSYPASADIGAKRIVKFSDTTATCKIALAAAATDPLIGISDAMGAVSGGMADVILAGIGEVVLGGTVAAGDKLTSDAAGAAVKCTGAANTRKEYVATATLPGVAGDIIPCLVERGVVQLPA
jgi:hypothetical protein